MTDPDMTIDIHEVTIATAALLDRVRDDVFDHAVRTSYLEAFLTNPANLLFVATADGMVVGMGSGIAYAHPDKPLQLFINEVSVSEAFQRRGIGARLVTALLDAGRTRGCEEAWVATEVGNAPARALYDALGGKEDEEHAVVYVYPLAAKR